MSAVDDRRQSELKDAHERAHNRPPSAPPGVERARASWWSRVAHWFWHGVLTPVRRFVGLPAGRSVAFTGRDETWHRGEDEAAAHLRRAGLRVLGRNLRVPMGEADLLCEDPATGTIVLVEVKARRVDPERPAPPPEREVDWRKRRTLRRILAYLVRRNRWGSRPQRIDVIGVEIDANGRCTLRHHVGAVR